MLLLLASVGIGITGAAPIFFRRKGREKHEEKIELVEDREELQDFVEHEDRK